MQYLPTGIVFPVRSSSHERELSELSTIGTVSESTNFKVRNKYLYNVYNMALHIAKQNREKHTLVATLLSGEGFQLVQ